MNNTLINELIQKLDGAYAESTIRAYRKNLESYATFCALKGYPFLPSPVEAIVNFIDHLTKLELSAFYIRRHVTAIAIIHRMSRYPDPTIDPRYQDRSKAGLPATWSLPKASRRHELCPDRQDPPRHTRHTTWHP